MVYSILAFAAQVVLSDVVSALSLFQPIARKQFISFLSRGALQQTTGIFYTKRANLKKGYYHD
ncbi:MAG: hypothetical protein COB83_08115 [Gammaproteobacteria bacterium]|nr:MAG: hypothetical protein COB83_08115 [Gammaproteobacteria bacterium]